MTAAGLVAGVLGLGGVGAVARFGLDSLIERRSGSAFPFGTLAVNVVGSLALGVLAGAAVTSTALLLAGTSLLGSFTTFSTWMLETERLAEEGERTLAALDVVAGVAAGLAAAALGFAAGAAL